MITSNNCNNNRVLMFKYAIVNEVFDLNLAIISISNIQHFYVFHQLRPGLSNSAKTKFIATKTSMIEVENIKS